MSLPREVEIKEPNQHLAELKPLLAANGDHPVSLISDAAIPIPNRRRDHNLAGLGVENPVDIYLAQIAKTPLLSAAEEVKLAQAIEKGVEARNLYALQGIGKERQPLDLARAEEYRIKVIEGAVARQHLIEANLRLVVSIAKRYKDRGVPMLDLIQEGNIGLTRAVSKFNWRLGFRFSTYATHWIRQGITRAIADQSRTIRLPVHMHETINGIRQEERQLESFMGREPTFLELSEALGMDPEQLRQVQGYMVESVSLNTSVGEDGMGILADYVEDYRVNPEELGIQAERREILDRVLSQLPKRLRRMLELRLGWEDGQPRTLEEVGKELGVTRERARQIELLALRKLRSPNILEMLQSLLD